jgi:thiosulfate reductase cytochrome b subunit
MANAALCGTAIGQPKEPVHPTYVRVTHWINAVAIVAMVGSGCEIYNASPLFPFLFPKSITLGGWPERCSGISPRCGSWSRMVSSM